MIQTPESAAAILPPAFGEPPVPYAKPHTYSDRLGRLFVAMAGHYRDGIDAINTVFNPELGDHAEGAAALYEDLVLEGATSDADLAYFLEQTACRPSYRPAERIRTSTLKDYSTAYLKMAIKSNVSTVGTQIGTRHKVLTTGPNRFTPETPRGLKVVKTIEGENGEKRTVQQKAELGSFFYWDSEPSINALLAMGEFDTVVSILDAYVEQIESYGGKILNWNNVSVDRTQLPMFFRMVNKTAEYMGDDILLRYLRPMVMHFNFLRDGMDDPHKLGVEPGSTFRRTGRLPNGQAALHNFDDLHDHTRPGNPLQKCQPRDEMRKQDLLDLKHYEEKIGSTLSWSERCDFFLGICAGAESSLDFTSDQADADGRFIGHRLINPAFNALYAEGAEIIAKTYDAFATANPYSAASAMEQAALFRAERQRVISYLHEYSYNPVDRMFGMYDFVAGASDPEKGRRRALSLNGIFVVSAGLTTPEIANDILEMVDSEFLQPGGLIAASRDRESDLQWDGKASWPILVRECVKAAIRYNRLDLAKKWLDIHIESDELLFEAKRGLGEKNDASRRGVALVIGEYGEVNDLTMTHAVYLWMKRIYGEIVLQQQRKATGRLLVITSGVHGS